MAFDSERDTPPLSPEEGWEMSFEADMRTAVDDLFTCEAIATRLDGLEDKEPISTLLSHHKQVLIEHLVETASRAVDEFVTTLDFLKNESVNPSPPLPNQRTDAGNRIE